MNPLVKKYAAQKRWVNWKLETRKGKTTKVPYSISGKLASSTDPSTWATYDFAEAASSNIGIVFDGSQTLLGIDIDHCLEKGKVVHEKRSEIISLLKSANTYTEISPSGNGLHLYLALTLPLTLTANRNGNFEAYTSGRYFTVTGVSFKTPRQVRTISSAEALELLAIIGYPWGKEESKIELVTYYDKKDDTHIILMPPEDGEALTGKMFASKNGEAVRALHDGDISQYRNDASAADMALLSHLAFWTGKNASQMEALWLASPLGARKKTQERKDYRDRSIAAAIARCQETYTAPVPASSFLPDGIISTDEMKEDDPLLALLYTTKDKQRLYIQNTENICRILRKHPAFAGTFRFDEFRNILERRIGSAWRLLDDNDAIDVQTSISILFSCFRRIGKEMAYDAIVKVSHENTIDSAADYVRSIVWDKVPRLDSWISWAFHTPDDAYHAQIGANWLKGLVKRLIEPGCKFDYVLVLEGEQGIRKSTSLAVLAGPLGHVETTMSTDSKDFFMQFQGKAIVEFSEGETLSRTEVKRMKAIITVQSDKYRPPYGRVSVDNPRRCVFAMTTNQTEYLKDETGNRRWLPVAVKGIIDTKWIEENRDQLYAEAYDRVIVHGETTYEFPEEEMLAAQQERRIHDPNFERIVEWYFKELTDFQRIDGITIQQVFQFGLNNGFPLTKPIARYEEMSMVDVLRTVLNLEKQQRMRNGYRSSRWFPTEKTPKPEFLIEIPLAAGEQRS